MNSILSAIGYPLFWRPLNPIPSYDEIDDIKTSIVHNIIQDRNQSILSTRQDINADDNNNDEYNDLILSSDDMEDEYIPVVLSEDNININQQQSCSNIKDHINNIQYMDTDTDHTIVDESKYSEEDDFYITVKDNSSSVSIYNHPFDNQKNNDEPYISPSYSISRMIEFQNKMLIHSPRNKFVEFDRARRKFLIKMYTCQGLETIVATGIHSTIKRFQPISISELCKLNTKKTRDKSSVGAVNTIKRVNLEWTKIIQSRDQVDLCSETEECPNCTKIDNKKHGSIVDSEVQMFTLPPINYNIENMFKYVDGGVDSCTIRVLLEIKRRDWSIISTQHKIYDEELGIATAVDIICRDNKTGKLIIIELKTSKHTSDEYYRYSHGDYFYEMIRAPNSFPESEGRIPFSMKNDDLLQILLTYVIIRERYGITPDITLLIRLGGDKIWCYDLDDWCYEIMPTLRRNILLHKQNIKSLKKIHKLSRTRK